LLIHTARVFSSDYNFRNGVNTTGYKISKTEKKKLPIKTTDEF
jgi:hypothetical protein